MSPSSKFRGWRRRGAKSTTAAQSSPSEHTEGGSTLAFTVIEKPLPLAPPPSGLGSQPTLAATTTPEESPLRLVQSPSITVKEESEGDITIPASASIESVDVCSRSATSSITCNEGQQGFEVHPKLVNKKKSAKQKYEAYVVTVGLQVGIFDTWDECHSKVNGVRGNCYKGFRNHKDAEIHFANVLDQGLVRKVTKSGALVAAITFV